MNFLLRPISISTCRASSNAATNILTTMTTTTTVAATKTSSSSLLSSSSTIVRRAHTVRVILTKDLPENNLYAGETHVVKAGYARNYLIPKKMALYATHQNFLRVGMMEGDPDLIEETEEERRAREERDSDEDLKAADFLRYYLRNKTLIIWRNVDIANITGSGISMEHAPIHPGVVTHENVREKLSKQLKIDLDDHEKVQIFPKPVNFAEFDDNQSLMEEMLSDMEPLEKDTSSSSDEEGKSSDKTGECKVQLKALGEYLVKIHLKGGHAVGLRLNVVKR